MIKLEKIAEMVAGELKGDPKFEISTVNSLQEASQHEISFCIKDQIAPDSIHAGALIVNRNSRLAYPNLIYVDHPHAAFAKLLDFFYPYQPFCRGIDPRASVSKGATIGSDVSIGPFSYVGDGCDIGDQTEIHAGVMVYRNVKIGSHCIIYANVVIREGVEIGDYTIIQPGAVIGADGFGFTRAADGTILKIPQKGRVIIGNHCEIGANTCVDRSTIDRTVIQDYVKTDNLVQIGHNVTIGRNTMISAQTGISGSTEIGTDVVMGGQVGIGDHIKITDGVMMAGKTGVTGHIREKSIVAGYPHQDIRKWRREQALIRNLERYIERIKILEEKVKKLEGK